MALAGTIVPALLSAIGQGQAGAARGRQAIMDYQFQAWNLAQQQKFSREMAEYAYQKDLEQWERQNAYNTPEQQMARFKTAGLNPHLIYGQGSPGNAQSTVSYHPPQVDFNLRAPQTFAAQANVMQQMVPTLMSVGSWIQDMRKSQVEIRNAELSGDKLQQLIAFLAERNPEDIRKLRNINSLFPFQADIMNLQRSFMDAKLADFQNEFRYKYGDNRYKAAFGKSPSGPLGGVRSLSLTKALAEAKLKEAQASWTDMNITDPQGLMQMVLQAVLGMAGTQLRLSTTPRKSGTRITETEKVKRVGRERTTTRSYLGND